MFVSVPISPKEQTFLWMSRIKSVGRNWKTLFVLCLFIVIVAHAMISTHRRPQNLTQKTLSELKGFQYKPRPSTTFLTSDDSGIFQDLFWFGESALSADKSGESLSCAVCNIHNCTCGPLLSCMTLSRWPCFMGGMWLKLAQSDASA